MTSFLLRSMVAMVVLFSVGCLQTRSGMREKEEKFVLRKTVADLQMNTAEVNTRFQEVHDEIRRLNGRIEVFENRMLNVSSDIERGDQQWQQRIQDNSNLLQAFREEIDRLNREVESLKAKLLAAESARGRASLDEKPAKTKNKDAFSVAEEKFASQSWKEAILDYERYRKSHPKGKDFAEATYKIGLSFEELGLKDEAKAFYDEVIAKFPKSRMAKKATAQLKSLEKK